MLMQTILESNAFHIFWNICGWIGFVVVVMTIIFSFIMIVCSLKEDYSEDRTYCIKFDCDCINPKLDNCKDCAYMNIDD